MDPKVSEFQKSLFLECIQKAISISKIPWDFSLNFLLHNLVSFDENLFKGIFKKLLKEEKVLKN